MRFHVYAINWNEERLLPAFFKHYSQADHIYILDNNSTDGSHAIIKQHSATIIPFDSSGNLNDNLHKDLKNTIWKQSRGVVDFVIVQDLDEFLHFPKFPNDIVSGLAFLKENNFTLSISKGYQMFCTDEEFRRFGNYNQSITSFITVGCIEPMNGLYNKCLVFNPNEITEINYCAGSHTCEPTGNIRADYRETLLLHYKYMGAEHLIHRYKLIRDRLSPENREQRLGIQYVKSDKEIREHIEHMFEAYYGFNIHRIMYEDTTIAGMTYRGANYIMHTFGSGDIISESLLNRHIWEPTVAEKIYELCSQPDTCYIDIGANIGTHVCIAKSAGAKMIYAFECNPRTAKKVSSTIRLNGWNNIKLFDIALSNKESTLPFTIVTDNIGASYIPANRKKWNGPLEAIEDVKCVTFDSLNLDIDAFQRVVVKMDIEGHEIYALEGMKNLLTNNKLQNMILELNPSCSFISTIEMTLDLLEKYNFVPDIILFKVPGDAWSGEETNNTVYIPITKDAIMSMIEENIILEVLFKRNTTL
jgi:FkbM family methyltransferase